MSNPHAMHRNPFPFPSIRAVLVLACMMLAACDTGQDNAKIEYPNSTPTPVEQKLLARSATRRVLVQVYAFELDSPRLRRALQLLGAAPQETEPGTRLKASRVLLTSIERDKLPLFLANLPDPLSGFGVPVGQLDVDHPVTLFTNTRRVDVEYFDAEGMPTVGSFGRGEYRLLVKMFEGDGETGNDAHRLRILPQHVEKTLLKISDPQDRSAEGDCFESLLIDQPIAEGECWLITRDPEPDLAPRAVAAESGEPSGNETRALLADEMFTGTFDDKPIRVLVFISLEVGEEKP